MEFSRITSFLFVIVSADVFFFQFTILLIGSIMSCLKTNRPELFVWSGGTYFAPRKLLPLGCPCMGQHHLHMFTVDYMYVQYSLVLDVFFLWFSSLVDYLGNQF